MVTRAAQSPLQPRWVRILLGCSAIVVVLLQVRLWISDDGMREVWRLEAGVAEQQAENTALAARNRGLIAEVQDLKNGTDAIEERARTDLGMIGVNETFVEVIPAPDGANAATPPIQAAKPAASGVLDAAR